MWTETLESKLLTYNGVNMNTRDLAEDIVARVVHKLYGKFRPEWYYEQDYREIVLEVENVLIECKELADSPEI